MSRRRTALGRNLPKTASTRLRTSPISRCLKHQACIILTVLMVHLGAVSTRHSRPACSSMHETVMYAASNTCKPSRSHIGRPCTALWRCAPPSNQHRHPRHVGRCCLHGERRQEPVPCVCQRICAGVRHRKLRVCSRHPGTQGRWCCWCHRNGTVPIAPCGVQGRWALPCE